MLGSKRPASTLEPESATPTGSKRFKTNRHQSQADQAPQPSTAASTAGSWFGPILKWSKTLLNGSPSAQPALNIAERTVSVNNANGSGRSRQKPLLQRSIPPPPSFKSPNDAWIWETMTARQRGVPPPVNPRVLEELGMSREGASRERNGSAFSTSALNGNRSAKTTGGYQRKKPMGSKEKPSTNTTTTSTSTSSRNQNRRRKRIPTPDFLRPNSNSSHDDTSRHDPSADESSYAQRSLFNFITQSLPLPTLPTPSTSSTSSSDSSDTSDTSSSSPSSNSTTSRSPTPRIIPATTIAPLSPIILSSSPSPIPQPLSFFSSPWLPSSLALIRQKQHRLALKNRDDQTLEMLKSLPSTPVEEEQLPQNQDEEFQVYKRGVKSLVEHEDVGNAVKPKRPSNPGRSSSSLLGPPSASYASVLSSSSSSKKPSTSTSRPLSKVEQTIEKYRKTQTESPARAQQVFEQFERLRVQQELEEKKALEELEKASAPAVQRKRKWPRKVPREIQERVSTILKQSGYDKTISGANVDSKAIKRLRPNVWLDDSIIAFYGVLINNRFLEAEKKGDLGKGEMELRKVWCFNSFFWNMYDENGYKRVKKWTKKFDTFQKDIIIFPINIRNSHWTCAAVNLKKKRFEYYDSLGNHMQKAHTLLRKWLQEEHECKKGGPLDLSDWEDYWDPNVPQQDNCNDCGVFTCCFMEILSREYDGFDFDHTQMPYLRQKIAYEIDRAELLPEEFE
ncbi:hypothetical protein JCM3765_007505 [Sporobolomyces pararoseus]